MTACRLRQEEWSPHSCQGPWTKKSSQMPNQNHIFLWYGMVQPSHSVLKAHLLKIEILLWTAECHPFQLAWEKGEAGLTPRDLELACHEKWCTTNTETLKRCTYNHWKRRQKHKRKGSQWSNNNIYVNIWQSLRIKNSWVMSFMGFHLSPGPVSEKRTEIQTEK